MAWMIPIVASRRRSSRSSIGAVIVGLLIFLIFGIFFLVFFNRSGLFGFNFPVIFIILGFVVFITVILGISQNHEIIQGQTFQQNPYVVREPIQKSTEPQYQEKPTEVFPIVNEINFCRYCGGNIDRESRFCHQCGSKL